MAASIILAHDLLLRSKKTARLIKSAIPFIPRLSDYVIIIYITFKLREKQHNVQIIYKS